jgi:hypothetical protein
MNTILKNIRQLAENEGLTVTGLEKVLGASKGVLSRAMANNSDIQAKWLLKLVENYPLYSCEWLIKSEGSMIKAKNYFIKEVPEVEREINYKELAESRKETIESLQKIIMHLERQIAANETKTK